MKYIRTKDEIFDIEKYGGIRTITKIYDIDENLRIKYENTNEPQQVGDRMIFIEGKDYKITDNNTADTIKELCDEFIIYDIHKKKWLHFIDLKSLLAYCEENGLDKTQIRGAIWTDKGLIYQAKVNSKGKLDLLKKALI